MVAKHDIKHRFLHTFPIHFPSHFPPLSPGVAALVTRARKKGSKCAHSSEKLSHFTNEHGQHLSYRKHCQLYDKVFSHTRPILILVDLIKSSIVKINTSPELARGRATDSIIRYPLRISGEFAFAFTENYFVSASLAFIAHRSRLLCSMVYTVGVYN